MTTFILRTSAGATITAYDDVEKARKDRDRRQPTYSKPLAIYRQQIIEEQVA